MCISCGYLHVIFTSICTRITIFDKNKSLLKEIKLIKIKKYQQKNIKSVNKY